MMMITCLLALMVYFDIRFSRIKNKWIILLFLTALFLKWQKEGGNGILYGGLQFLTVFMILLPVFACRVLGAADVKIFLALSVYLPFWELCLFMICSLVLGGLFGLILLIFPKKYKSSFFFSMIRVKNDTTRQVPSVQGNHFIPGLTFHYIHFTIPIFISFLLYAYGGVYELLLCYLR